MNMQLFLQQLGQYSPTLLSSIGRGKTFFLDPSKGKATGNGLTPLEANSSFTTTKAKLTTGQHDTIKFIAGATGSSLTAAVDWSLNCSHLIGEGVYGMMNQRARFTHGGNVATLFTVSGYGNSFQNLCWQHGRGNATNVNLMTLTGNRDSFINCHFNGPINATEGDQAYDLIRISGEEYLFDRCIIGADNIFFTGVPQAAAVAGCSLVRFEASSAPRGVFRDCLFVMKADSVDPVFLRPMYDLSEAAIWFINCAFLNIGTSSLKYAIDYDGTATGLNANAQMFFHNCSFAGVDDIIPAGDESRVWFSGSNTPINQVTGGASVALFNGLAAHPDVV